MKRSLNSLLIFAVALTFVLGSSVSGAWGAFNNPHIVTAQHRSADEDTQATKDSDTSNREMDRGATYNRDKGSSEFGSGVDLSKDFDSESKVKHYKDKDKTKDKDKDKKDK